MTHRLGVHKLRLHGGAAEVLNRHRLLVEREGEEARRLRSRRSSAKMTRMTKRKRTRTRHLRPSRVERRHSAAMWEARRGRRPRLLRERRPHCQRRVARREDGQRQKMREASWSRARLSRMTRRRKTRFSRTPSATMTTSRCHRRGRHRRRPGRGPLVAINSKTFALEDNEMGTRRHTHIHLYSTSIQRQSTNREISRDTEREIVPCISNAFVARIF